METVGAVVSGTGGVETERLVLFMDSLPAASRAVR